MSEALFYSPVADCYNFFHSYLEGKQLLTQALDKADYILLPFDYEIIYDYSDIELLKYNLTRPQANEMAALAKELDELSVTSKKKLVVFFYRDPEMPLFFRNSIVFRTSARRNDQPPNVFGMPAFIEHKPGNEFIQYRKKSDKPGVSFRGQAAPLKLPFNLQAKYIANQCLSWFGIEHKFRLWHNEGYLLRRAAIKSIIKKSSYFVCDFVVNPVNDISQQNFYTIAYLESFLKNDYFICVAGHGNYSYRLYEVMREGRIPVFIDTNCLLPFPEAPEWKSLVIQIPKSDVDKTADIILDFHASIRPDDFLERQEKIRTFWENNFTMSGFSKYLVQNVLVRNGQHDQ